MSGPPPAGAPGALSPALRASTSHTGTQAVARPSQAERGGVHGGGRPQGARASPLGLGYCLHPLGSLAPGGLSPGSAQGRAIPRGDACAGPVLHGGQGLPPSPFPIPEHPQGKHGCKPSPQHSGAPRPLSTEPLALPRLSGAEVTGNDCAGQSPQGCKRASWTAGLAPLRAALPRGSHTYQDSRTPGPPAGPAFGAAATGQEAEG